LQSVRVTRNRYGYKRNCCSRSLLSSTATLFAGTGSGNSEVLAEWRFNLEAGMAKNDVLLTEYDRHQIELTKGCFLFYRADTDNETWVLGPKESGCEVYLRQKRFDWKYWNRNSKTTSSQPAKPKALTVKPRCFAYVGTFEGALAELKKFGIEEQHLEVFKARGLWE
jgi:hypothetical protein